MRFHSSIAQQTTTNPDLNLDQGFLMSKKGEVVYE